MSKIYDIMLDYIIWLQHAATRKTARGKFAKESLAKLKELIGEHDPEWKEKIRQSEESKE